MANDRAGNDTHPTMQPGRQAGRKAASNLATAMAQCSCIVRGFYLFCDGEEEGRGTYVSALHLRTWCLLISLECAVRVEGGS